MASAGTPATKRLPWIDALRGAAILLMCFDHFLLWLPALSSLRKSAYECLGFVSMAEIFVFLSGLTASHAYFGPSAEKPQARERILNRAGQIYAAHLVTALFVVIARLLWQRPDQVFAGGADPLTSLFYGYVLFYTPELLDILPLYCLLLLMLYCLVKKLGARKNLSWSLAVSLLVWLATQYVRWPGRLRPFSGIGFPYHNPFSWQVLFFLGVVAGLEPPAAGKRASVMRAAVFGLLAAALWKIHKVPFYFSLVKLQAVKSTLGSMRLLNFLVLFGLAREAGPLISKLAFPRWLTVIGANSLWVFMAHIAASYLLRFDVFGEVTSASPGKQAAMFCALLATAPLSALAADTLRASLPAKR